MTQLILSICSQFIGVSRDGYVSLLDEEGHLRSDLEVSNDDTVKTLKDKMDKMNADTETDVMVCLGVSMGYL